jgi:predicted homoserine dehydrogenase-like protein
LKYFKLGEGPHYVLLQSFILCHLEIVKTIRRVLKGGGVLLDNTDNPQISVAAVSKGLLRPGNTIRRGIGSFEVRGVAVTIADHPDHVPIGLLADAAVVKKVEPGQLVGFDDIEIPESLALHAWLDIQQRTQPSLSKQLRK